MTIPVKDLTLRLRALFSDQNIRAILTLTDYRMRDTHWVNSNDDQGLSYRSPSTCSFPENVHPRLKIVVCEASDFLSCFALMFSYVLANSIHVVRQQ